MGKKNRIITGFILRSPKTNTILDIKESCDI